MATKKDRAKPGRKPKGVRTTFTARVPTAHMHQYDSRARELGLVRSDYVALIMARAHGFPDPEYLQQNPNQLELITPGGPDGRAESSASAGRRDVVEHTRAAS